MIRVNIEIIFIQIVFIIEFNVSKLSGVAKSSFPINQENSPLAIETVFIALIAKPKFSGFLLYFKSNLFDIFE